MSSLQVNTAELRAIAQRLLVEKDEVESIYNNKVKGIIDASKEAIVVSKLDFDDVSKQFQLAFSNLSNYLQELSNALTTKVISQYENLDSNVTTSFNTDFANEMRDILNKQ